MTVTGSVPGAVLASLLARDYGIFSVAILGIGAYLCVVAISLGGMVVSLGPLLRRVLL
jgi:hypothetical protein